MSLVRLAFAAESVFALDKEITGLDQVPLRDLQVLAAKQVMRYLSTNGIADLEAIATEWTKVREDAAGAMAAYAAAERARAESMAAKMKAKGYTHRVSGWIHPTEGDDYPFEGFTVGTPSPVFIGKLLAKSEVKNDYVVTEI